ncbi:MAG TPA: ABC transporter permease, partial [Gaiellales bacterium]|nr:ABC transporter permease [Gaiellales bacterium]
RIGVFVVTLLIASVAVFLVLAWLPGDPAEVAAGTQATPTQVAELRKEFGLDGSPAARYGNWLKGVVTGDLGKTFISKRSIASELEDRMPVTLPLVFLGMFLAIIVAVPLGVIAAVRHRRAVGTGIAVVSQIGIAIPAFWAGLLLTTFVAVRWGILPAGGILDWDDPWEAVKILVLPAVSLAIVQGAILTRYVRSAVLEVMREDFVRTARAKGASRSQTLRRHVLRNAAIPVVTVLGLQLTALLVGAVVIENVFTLNGLGTQLVDAIGNREVVLVQDLIMFLTAAVLLTNLVVDLAYHAIDPRLRARSR